MIRNRQQGFTLIEMSVVVVIVAVLSAIVLPRLMVNKRGDDYRKSLQRIESVANAARDMAIRNGKTYELSFDSSSQTLTAGPVETEEQGTGSNTPTPNDDDQSAGESKSASLGADWSFVEMVNSTSQSNGSQLLIRFFADGSAEARDAKFESGDVEVHLTVNTLGVVKVKRGASESDTAQEWEAGDLEQRTN